MFDKKIFSERVKQLRLVNNTSQEQLAKALDSTKASVSDLERQYRLTTIPKLYELADYFDVSTDYLLGRTDNPNSHKA